MPTHNDITAYDTLSIFTSDQIEEQTLLRDTMKRKIFGKIIALKAAQIFESKVIAVPKILIL
ncbi:MAG TPA: hypothetical protein ACHBZA_12825 [Arsenophonus apicola]